MRELHAAVRAARAATGKRGLARPKRGSGRFRGRHRDADGRTTRRARRWSQSGAPAARLPARGGNWWSPTWGGGAAEEERRSPPGWDGLRVVVLDETGFPAAVDRCWTASSTVARGRGSSGGGRNEEKVSSECAGGAAARPVRGTDRQVLVWAQPHGGGIPRATAPVRLLFLLVSQEERPTSTCGHRGAALSSDPRASRSGGALAPDVPRDGSAYEEIRFFVDWLQTKRRSDLSFRGRRRVGPGRVHGILAPTEESTLRNAKRFVEARTCRRPRFLG